VEILGRIRFSVKLTPTPARSAGLCAEGNPPHIYQLNFGADQSGPLKVEVVHLIPEPWDPGPVQALALAA